jgi:hypothetical protein
MYCGDRLDAYHAGFMGCVIGASMESFDLIDHATRWRLAFQMSERKEAGVLGAALQSERVEETRE